MSGKSAESDDGVGCLLFIGIGLFATGLGYIYGTGVGFLTAGAIIMALFVAMVCA